MPERVRSLALEGIEGYEVAVECDISGGLPAFDIVGLPDAAVREARERVRAAMKNCGFAFPARRITVNLAPAGTRKTGSLYDLPILLSILQAQGEIELPENAVFLGELSLYGELRPAAGVLPMATAALDLGVEAFFCPRENAREASLARGLPVYPVGSVAELMTHLTGQTAIAPTEPWEPDPPPHGTTGILYWLAIFMIFATSSVVEGWQMKSGFGVSMPRSCHISGIQ